MYLFMSSSVSLGGKARSNPHYRRMAIVELEPGFEGRPKMISTRAIGVKRIVREVTAHVGTTLRSYGYATALAMKAEVQRLNQGKAS